MADRSIQITLRANVDEFKRNVTAASKSLDELRKNASMDQAQTGMGKIAQSMRLQREAWDKVGASALAYSGVVTAVGVKSVGAAADFDQAMSSVQAATHESADNMELLRAAARDAGADTVYSATESAGAIEALAKAGISTADILNGGLKGALDLASAGSMDVGAAAEIAATALTQFKLGGEDVSHVADLLAAGAGKAQGDVSDLGQALQQSGLIASQAGLSIEETTGALSAFASAGLIGSDAGTSLKNMLQRLQNPTKESAGLLEELGISMYDSQGEFVGLTDLAGQMQAAFEELTPAQRDAAMAQIFGSDAVRAANVLYSQGPDGIQAWIDAVNESGYAAETAGIMQDNLRGDLEKLGGAIDDLFISMGGSAQGPLRELVQVLTGIVDAFNSLPGPVKDFIAIAGGLTALVAGVGGAFMLAAPRVMESVSAFNQLRNANLPVISKSLDLVGSSMGKIAKAGTAATVIFSLASAANSIRFDTIGADVSEMSGALLDMARNGETTSKAMTNLYNSSLTLPMFRDEITTLDQVMDQLGNTMDRAWNGSFGDKLDRAFGSGASKRAKEQIQELDAALADLVNKGNAEEAAMIFDTFQAKLDSLDLEIADEEVIGMLTQYRGAVEQSELAVEAAGQTVAESTGEFNEQADAALDAAQAMRDVIDASQVLAQANMSLDELTMRYNETLASVTESLHAGAGASATGTKAQQENMQSLIDLTRAGHAQIDALVETNATADEVARGQRDLAVDFMKTAAQMGINQEEAFKLAQDYGLVPDDISTAAEFNKVLASGTLAAWISQLNSADGRTINTYTNHIIRTSHVTTFSTVNKGSSYGGGLNAARNGYTAFAEGGYTGDGGKYEPAGVVHRGEWVLNSHEVGLLGGPGGVKKTLKALGLPGYADGGFVSAPAAARTAGVTLPSQTGGATAQVYIDKVINPVEEPATITAVNQLQKAAALTGGLV